MFWKKNRLQCRLTWDTPRRQRISKDHPWVLSGQNILRHQGTQLMMCLTRDQEAWALQCFIPDWCSIWDWNRLPRASRANTKPSKHQIQTTVCPAHRWVNKPRMMPGEVPNPFTYQSTLPFDPCFCSPGTCNVWPWCLYLYNKNKPAGFIYI